MKKVISITILITFFLQRFALADLKENVNFYSSTISKLNTPVKKNKTCYADIKESKNCSFLFNLFERDQSTGMFFGMISDSPWDSCKKAITQNKNLSTNELEAIYSKHERTALGLRPGYFSGKMEQCFNSKNKKLSANDLDIQKK